MIDGGKGWRSGAPVEQKNLTQWFLRISDYAEDLLAALDTLARWPEEVRLMQANWIGRSEGLECRFELSQAVSEIAALIFIQRGLIRFTVPVFVLFRPTTRSPFSWPKTMRLLAAFRTECAQRGTSEADIEAGEKLGFDTGADGTPPAHPEWHLPVYVANFVLMGYGTGAIFACLRMTSAIWILL